MPYYANGTGRDSYILDVIRGGADHNAGGKNQKYNKPVSFYHQKRSNDRNVLPAEMERSQKLVGPFAYTTANLLSMNSSLRDSLKRPQSAMLFGAGASTSNHTTFAAMFGSKKSSGYLPQSSCASLSKFSSPATAAVAHARGLDQKFQPATLMKSTSTAAQQLNAFFDDQKSVVKPGGLASSAENTPATVLNATMPGGGFVSTQSFSSVPNPSTRTPPSQKAGQPPNFSTSGRQTHQIVPRAQSADPRIRAAAAPVHNNSDYNGSCGRPTPAAKPVFQQTHQKQQAVFPTLLQGDNNMTINLEHSSQPLPQAQKTSTFLLQDFVPKSSLSSFERDRVVPLEDMRRLKESVHQGEERKKLRTIHVTQKEMTERISRPQSRDMVSIRVGSRDRLYRHFNSSRRSLNSTIE
ncbi:unnamed protein product [Amoebophrya sp. A120]|nr:unnamed protein product [Amoebophrya sp. A120]|eukprot:GSA120T00010644001.1